MSKKWFLILSIVAAIAVTTAWIWIVSNPVPSYTVAEGKTQTIRGVTWHLDWMKEVSFNDPALAESYFDSIDGATYILVQYTYSGTEPFSPCSGYLLGDGRNWWSSLIRPASPELTDACDDAAAATEQLAFIVPPDAVSEVRSLQINMPDYNVHLQGRVH